MDRGANKRQSGEEDVEGTTAIEGESDSEQVTVFGKYYHRDSF